MKVKFFLNPPNKSGECLIVMKTWDITTPTGLPTVFSTNEKILPRHWKDGRAVKSFPQSLWLNAILDKYENKALNFIRQHQIEHDRPPSSEEIKTYLNDFKAQLSGKAAKKEKDTSFMGIARTIISELETKNKRAARGTRTWETYKSTMKEVEAFVKETRRSFDWEAIDTDWLAAYQEWLFARGNNHNTVTGKFKRVKRVLNYAKDEGLYKGEQHRRRSLALSFQRSDEIYLTVDDLMQLYHLDLSHTTLERTRDTFLLDAFAAGFRFGDLEGLGAGKIIDLAGRQALKLHTGKTDTAVVTPGSWYLDEFLEKYKNGFPKRITGQVYNRNIKKICKLAGLDRPTTLRKNIKGKNEDVTKPLYMWARAYTARYSFATNLYLAGVELKMISVLLGHSNTTTTETYIKAKQMATALKMSELAFFAEKPKVRGAAK